ncbi:hypothetical protein ZWY2020_001270 [Hordeum vulgare]|nr:hypothetical protein ZWY2020_001270 [Hordeum vulgare]
MREAKPSPEAKPLETGSLEIDGVDPHQIKSTTDGDSHWRWVISFIDPDLVPWAMRPGFLYLHLGSHWITVRDNDLDILAGRFWVLADRDEEEEDGAISDSTSPINLADSTLRVPLMPMLNAPRNRSTADFQLVKTKPAASTSHGSTCPMVKGMKPWIGPLPKVNLSPCLLADFFHQDCWNFVKKNKKFRTQIALSSPSMSVSSVMDSRRDFFKSLGIVDGPVEVQVGLDCEAPGYVAQDTAHPIGTSHTCDNRVDLGGDDSTTDSPDVASNPCTQPPEPRVLQRLNHGFPSLGTGRAARVPPLIGIASRSMAGRGNPKQPPALQPSPRPPGQGSRPHTNASKASAPASVEVGRPPNADAQAGSPPSAAVQLRAPGTADANWLQPRGWWGDDGVNVYGDGQHRGSSSSGGGRGYAWQNNGGSGNGFTAPLGKSIPGTSGPPHPKRGGFRQNWGGRGGGRKSRPPFPTQDASADFEVSTMATVTEPVKEVADPALADQSLVVAKGDGGDRPSKWARKKDKLTCYRCSVSAPSHELRFGSFEPASAPAKVGGASGLTCKEGQPRPRLPRFLGKNPWSNVDLSIAQSNNMLQPVSLGKYLAGAKSTSSRPCVGGSTAFEPEAVHGVAVLEGGAVALAPASASVGTINQANPVATLGEAVLVEGVPAGAGVSLLSADGKTTPAGRQPAGDDDGLLAAGSGLCTGGGYATELDTSLCSAAPEGKAQAIGLPIDDDSTSLAESAFVSTVGL